MAFQPFQPYSGRNKKRKTQTGTGANMAQEGSMVNSPNPITTQGPLQNTASETAAKKAAAGNVMAPPANMAQFGAENAIGTTNEGGGAQGGLGNLFGGDEPTAVLPNRAPPTWQGASGARPSHGFFDFNNPNSGNISGRDNDPLGGGGYDDSNVNDEGPVDLGPVGEDLRAEIERILGQDAAELARKEAGRVIAANRQVMGRHGGTGGREAFGRDTTVMATDLINERLNREKMTAARAGSDLDRWQNTFDRSGDQWERGFDRAGDQFERTFDRQSDMWEATFQASGRAEDRAVAAERLERMYQLMEDAEVLYGGDAAAMAEAMRAMVDPITQELMFTEEQILMATKELREQTLANVENQRERDADKAERDADIANADEEETEDPSGWLTNRLDEEIAKGDQGRAWLINDGDHEGDIMWKMDIPATWVVVPQVPPDDGWLEYPDGSGERWGRMENTNGDIIWVRYSYMTGEQQAAASAGDEAGSFDGFGS
jgi:hypothetical protein